MHFDKSYSHVLKCFIIFIFQKSYELQHQKNVIDIILVFLLLILNIFHTFF